MMLGTGSGIRGLAAGLGPATGQPLQLNTQQLRARRPRCFSRRVTRLHASADGTQPSSSHGSKSSGKLLDFFAEQDPNSIYAGCGLRVAAADYDILLSRQDRVVSFKIPVAGPTADVADCLACPTVRHLLQEQPHVNAHKVAPDGRFVDDGDRVGLNAMGFASPNSTGAKLTWWGPADSNGNSSASSTSSEDSDGAIRGGIASLPRVRVALPTFGVRAGPRQKIYWNPQTVTAAIVTTGGIAPGVNNAIRNLVLRLSAYGVPTGSILGVRYGVRGFLQKDCKPVVLTPASTDGIHLQGGSFLGTSVLEHEVVTGQGKEFQTIARKLKNWGINMLFVIGGEGGMRMVTELSEWCAREQVACSIIGLPKSIENDVLLVDKCMGFQTVVQEAERPLLAAKTEASSARSGIGLVKLMGRRSGFIPMQASLSSGVVDVCLIPEVPFQLEGPHGLLAYVSSLLDQQGHAVVAVADGAGQELMYPAGAEIPQDERGNLVLKDIGLFLKKKFKQAIPDADIKYIDPTYMIQATACNSLDHIFTKTKAYHAVDAAFAGYTGTCVGQVQSHFSLLPAPVLTLAARRLDPDGKMWNRLRAAIGQPQFQEPPPGPDGAEVVDPFATRRSSTSSWSVLSSAAGILGVTDPASSSSSSSAAGSRLATGSQVLLPGKRSSLVEQVMAKEASMLQRRGMPPGTSPPPQPPPPAAPKGSHE